MKNEIVSKGTLLCLVILISALFLSMIQQFLMAVFMAGLFSAMVIPVHHWLTDKLGGKETLASILIVLGIVILVLTPLAVLITLVVTQAIHIGQQNVRRLG